MFVSPATAGDINRRSQARPGQPRQKARPYLKNNQGKKSSRCGSHGRAPAWQAQSPEFKLHYAKKKK
jgi:hypothetical protein